MTLVSFNIEFKYIPLTLELKHNIPEIQNCKLISF